MAKNAMKSSMPRSMAPQSKNGVLSRLPTYTLIYIPNESGASRRISVPKALVFVGIVGLFCLFGGVTALSVTCARLKSVLTEYDSLKAENHSIRSEAAALVAKLQEVQSNLNRVDKFSDEVREVAQDVKPTAQEANASKKKSRYNRTKPNTSAEKLPQGNTQGNVNALAPNIGPLTKEEYALSKKRGGIEAPSMPLNVKFDSLEFKDLFVQLSDIKNKSGNQAEELQGLLETLQLYRLRLASTPSISPVSGWVSSLYGMRASPITGQNRMHQGLDIAAPLGTPIRTAANGTVARVGFADDYGNYAEISHGHGIISRYAHAKSIAVHVGQVVKKGDLIGEVGATGRTTGPHLHYEVVMNGRKVNPATFIRE